MAIGDPLGATVEFMRPHEIALQYGTHREIVGGGWLKLARGQVTDDTTMSLALGNALLQGGSHALRRHTSGDDTLVRHIGQAFVQWLLAKPVVLAAQGDHHAHLRLPPPKLRPSV